MNAQALDALRKAMLQRRIDAWCVYDFRNSNHVLPRLLPFAPGSSAAASGKRHVTRRIFFIIPAHGSSTPPTLLAHGLDANNFEGLNAPDPALKITIRTYTSWVELHAALNELLPGGRIAMEYAPGCTLPVMSNTDAGTVELIRGLGREVVSSADLVQVSIARWSAAAVKHHLRAGDLTVQIVHDAFEFIGEHVKGTSKAPLHEHEVAEFIRDRFRQEQLDWPDGPIVAVNQHAGDPHFEPSAKVPTPIKPGDLVLIDLWARAGGSHAGDHQIHSDITWMGFVSSAKNPKPSRRQQRVFEIVTQARDAALQLAQAAWKKGQEVQGWQLDDAARHVLLNADRGEYAPYIRHRTGHSLSPGPLVHGLGMNLDNLETHDTRAMIPGIGFTIEPGLYLPEFGVRSEINVYVDPKKGPMATGVAQREFVIV